MKNLKIFNDLDGIGCQPTKYRVIKVRCISGRGTIDSTDSDREAVEFLRNFAFANLVKKQEGDWKMFKDASAASTNLVFSVYHCSPSANNGFVDMRTKIPEMKHLGSGSPGYFLMTRFDIALGHEVKVDVGYASHIRYQAGLPSLIVFDAFGKEMATWEIFCVPQDYPLPEGYVVQEQFV